MKTSRPVLPGVIAGAFCASVWLGAAPIFGDGNDLLKPGATSAPADEPNMSAVEMKAAGERATKAADKLGWRIGVQAWTFNRRSFYETIDIVQSLGLHYIEGYPGQIVDKDKNVTMGPDLPKQACEAIKKRLADADIKIVNFGVTGLSKNEAQSRRTFEFAKEMGIETIVSEPPEDAFDTLDKLTQEYGINVAIHNHPGPKNHYWNPDTVLKVIAGRNPRIGDCADVGHWQRSGVNPIEALQKLKGHIICSHFKDLSSFGDPKAIDVPWGTGTGNARGMLEEIHKQDAKIVFSIEYEHFSPGLKNDVARSIKWFADECEELGKE
jgi:sugar phosphate isomerase/epimerase